MGIQEFISTYRPNLIRQPFVIAEAGVNHEGSLDLAKRLIDEAAEGGADAIKFQTYKANTIASKNSPYYWDLSKEPTRSQFELFQKYDKFWKNEYGLLAEHCKNVGIEFMSTPFDAESAHFLNTMMNAYKISSSDLTNHPFIELQCKFGKPVLLSTGASHLWEIQEAVSIIEKYKNPLVLFHCVLNYPTPDQNANLGMIRGLIQHFSNMVPGYSDHTLPKDMETCVAAYLLGAVVIEKHFTHDKSLPGNDHYHAMDKEDLKHFRKRIERTMELLGTYEVKSLPDEEPARRNARRSLVAVTSIPKGTVLTEAHLTWKRPAHGVSPRFIHEVIGKETILDIEEDALIQWNMLS